MRFLEYYIHLKERLTLKESTNIQTASLSDNRPDDRLDWLVPL